MYHEGFGLSIQTSAVIFLTLMIGLLPSLLVRIYDYHLAGKRQKQGRVLKPEDKLVGFLIATPVNAAALWWFAWTIPPHAGHLSPWVSIAALLPLGFATNKFDQVLTVYLCDTYTSIAGSAAAPLSFLRAMLSAAYPLFATKMFTRMGNNPAVSVIAGVATLYCVAAWAFWKHGKKIRAKNPWVMANAAAIGKQEKSDDVYV